MATNNSITLTLGYENSDFERKYILDGVATADLEYVKERVLAYNQNLAQHTKDKDIFIADDYDASDSENVIGRLKGITAAQYSVTTTTQIPLN